MAKQEPKYETGTTPWGAKIPEGYGRITSGRRAGSLIPITDATKAQDAARREANVAKWTKVAAEGKARHDLYAAKATAARADAAVGRAGATGGKGK